MHRQMALELAQQRKREEETGQQTQKQEPQPPYMSSSFGAGAEGGSFPPTDSLRASMENPLAIVPHGAPQLPLIPHQSPHRRPPNLRPPGTLNPELQNYLAALTGPDDRAPLVYSGDIKASLDQLRHDAVSRYQALSYALGERVDRLDLLLGSLGGRLGLPPGPPMPSLPSTASAPTSLSLPPLDMNHYSPSRAPMASSAGSIGYSYRGSSAWSGGMEPPGSASFFGEGLVGGGLRIAPFEMEAPPVPEADLLSGMMVGREVTRMVYPQVGADFEGRQSRSAMAAQRIDSLRDLRYAKPSNIRYDDLLIQVASNGGMPGSQDVPRQLLKSQQRSEFDQAERFLRDFASRETRSRGLYVLPPTSNARDDDPTLEPLKDQESSWKRSSFTLPQI